MKNIKLSEKESRKISENMKRAGIILKKPIKKLVFHKEFDKGLRFWLCQNCSYPAMFFGMPMIACECDNPKGKVYSYEQLEDFILKMQEIWYAQRNKQRKKGNHQKEAGKEEMIQINCHICKKNIINNRLFWNGRYYHSNCLMKSVRHKRKNPFGKRNLL